MSIRSWAPGLLLIAATGLGCETSEPTSTQPPTTRPAPAPTANTATARPDPSSKPAEPQKEAPKVAAPEAPKPERPPIVPVGIAEAKKRAYASANGGNLSAAIKLLEEGLQSSPKDREGLFMISAMTESKAAEFPPGQDQRDGFRKAAEYGRKLQELYKDLNERESLVLAQVYYNEACALSLEGKPEEARKALIAAGDVGFEDQDMLDTDKDIDAVRKLPKFDELKKDVLARADLVVKSRVQASLKTFPTFPFDFSLKGLDGKEVKLSDLKGKAVIVDVWGTWCPPCRQEIPHFVELYKKYNAKGFEIVGINYENGSEEDARASIKTFTEKVKIPYTLVLGDEATQNRIPNFAAFPTTLFIDRTGKVRMKLVGYTPMSRLEAIVRTLVDEK